MTIPAKYQIGLLVATALLAGLSAVPGFILLTRSVPEKTPAVVILRSDRPSLRWKGWELTPRSPDASTDCVQGGFDRCSDGQDPDDDNIIDGTDDDNPPVSI
jgi:hypothetical protein